MHLALQAVAQLDLVHLEIAADEHDHDAVVGFLLIGHGLQKSAHVLVQELRHFLDGLHLGRRDLGERLLLAGHGLVLAVGVFHVCAVVAVRANHQIVLADGRAQHELVRHLAAHHAAVGLDRDNLRHAAAREDALVRLVAAGIVRFEVFLAGVEGVRVLHREFAHADQTAAGAGLVAELGLNLIDHERILLIALRGAAGKLNGGFLVRHAQNHVVVASVVEAHHFAGDGIVAAGLAPQARGHDHGHQNLLPVDAVHFLAQNRLNLAGDVLGDREQRVDAVSDVLDVAAANHEDMAGDLAVGGGVLKTLGQHLSEFHELSSFLVPKNKPHPSCRDGDMASAVPPCLTLARPTYAPHIAGETAPCARGSESGRDDASCAGFQP